MNRLFKKIIKYSYEYFIDYIIAPIFKLFPVTNTILLESVPSMSDSAYEVYKELLRRKINQKYRIVWWLYDNDKGEQVENVQFIRNNDCRLKIKFYEYTSKVIISSNRFISSHSNNQISFYISHGSPIKKLSDYYYMPDDIDYFFCASEGFREIFAEQIHADPSKGICLGLPRNDVLGTKPSFLASQLFGLPNCKSIIWYPTFRQHKAGLKTGSSISFPILHDEESIEKLNDYLKEKNTIIIIKPHFAQDLRGFKERNLSNIFFINDQFFKDNCVSSYEFVNSADALITDYSSIYFDYLLCDKPIALAWEDVEEYRSNPGYAVDIDYMCKGGEKIYNVFDLFHFIDEISFGIDLYKNEREEINSIANYSNDHLSTNRVVDKILELSSID